MSTTSLELRMLFLFALSYLIAPVLLIWGWSHWTQQPKLRSVSAMLSLGGFVLATASALLACATVVYSQVKHHPFYDPELLKIFQTGAFMSLSGIIFGLCGIARSSSLRWHAPASGAATLAFWLLALTGR